MNDNRLIDTLLYSGKYLKIVKRNNWEFVERNGPGSAVIIIPIIGSGKDKSLVLIEEYRQSLQALNISLPAGLIGDNGEEEPEEAAKRELIEETGYSPGRLRFLTAGVPSSGLTNEMLYFYLADDLSKIQSGGGVEDESIKVKVVKIDDVDEWLKSQVYMRKYIDPKIYIALHFANNMDTK